MYEGSFAYRDDQLPQIRLFVDRQKLPIVPDAELDIRPVFRGSWQPELCPNVNFRSARGK